jgi:hypothetical protein
MAIPLLDGHLTGDERNSVVAASARSTAALGI